MRRMLISTLFGLVLCLTAGAQARLYVCHRDSCEVYDTEHIDSVIFQFDSFRIGGQPPYSAAQVDSIVFRQPYGLTVEERGWCGDMGEGESRFLAALTARDTDSPFDYHAEFTFTAHDSICQTAKCELTFDEEWECELVLLGKDYGIGSEEHEEDSESAPSGGGDPYIYVKETLTGPRRFETWPMGNPPVLPTGCIWETGDDGLSLRADCSPILADRPMYEVKQIVEAWLFQPYIKIENP